MRRKIKMCAVVLACTLAVGTITVTGTGCSFAGKKINFSTGLSDDDVFKIDRSACKKYMALMMLTTEKNLYEQTYGSEIWSQSINGTTFESYVKDNVKNELAQMKTLNLLAKKKDIELSGEEEQVAKDAGKKYYESLTEDERDFLDVDEDDCVSVYKQYCLAQKVYKELTKDVNPEISDAEAKIIKVQSIYGKTYVVDAEGNRTEYSEIDKLDVKKDMEALLEEINNGGDFTTIAANNTDANEVEYQFGKGEMIEEFEQAAFSLTTGQVSGLIETKDGYYIIKCLSDYMADETTKHKADMVQKAKDQAFLEEYNPYVASLSSEFNDELWDSIKLADLSPVKNDTFYSTMEALEN